MGINLDQIDKATKLEEAWNFVYKEKTFLDAAAHDHWRLKLILQEAKRVVGSKIKRRIKLLATRLVVAWHLITAGKFAVLPCAFNAHNFELIAEKKSRFAVSVQRCRICGVYKTTYRYENEGRLVRGWTRCTPAV